MPRIVCFKNKCPAPGQTKADNRITMVVFFMGYFNSIFTAVILPSVFNKIQSQVGIKHDKRRNNAI